MEPSGSLPLPVAGIFPTWDFDQRFIQQQQHRKNHLTEIEQRDMQQAVSFVLNVSPFASQVADSIAQEISENIKNVLLNPKRAIPSADKPLKMSWDFCYFNNFSRLAGDKIELSPFVDWKNNIFPRNSSNFFDRIRKAVFSVLIERIAEFKRDPDNISAELVPFNIDGESYDGEGIGRIEASFWVNLAKQKTKVKRSTLTGEQELSPLVPLRGVCSITRFLDERKRLDKERVENLRKQEADFEQNFKLAAAAIAQNIAGELFSQMDRMLKSRDLMPSETKPHRIFCRFIQNTRDFDSLDPFYRLLVENNKALSPFADWSKSIHFYADDQDPLRCLHEKIARVRDEAKKQLFEILTQYKRSPQTEYAQFSVGPSDNKWSNGIYRHCDIQLLFWAAVPVPAKQDAGFLQTLMSGLF